MAIKTDQDEALKKLIRRTILCGLLVIILLILVWMSYRQQEIWRYNRSLISPVNNNSSGQKDFGLVGEEKTVLDTANQMQTKNLSSQPVIYGFLPYWNLSDELQLPAVLTDLNYFRLAVGDEGHLMTENSIDGLEIGWQKLQSESWQNTLQKWQGENGTPKKTAGVSAHDVDHKLEKNTEQKRLALTLFIDDSSQLEQLLLNEDFQNNFASDLNLFLLNHPEFQEINLDFEYFGSVDETLRLGMTNLLARLRLLIVNYHPQTRLTIDVFGKSPERLNSLYDWQAVQDYVDYVILMAYDYKTRSSSAPGPIAPTLGAEQWGGNDVLTSLKALLEKVPSYQVLLAVPFYGYQWQVTNFDLETARTYPETGQTVSYRRVRELLAQAQELKIEDFWDEASLTPYLTYTDAENQNKYMIFYEDDRSLQYKLDLVKEMNLAGVAIWALGYEGETTELWSVVENADFSN